VVGILEGLLAALRVERAAGGVNRKVSVAQEVEVEIEGVRGKRDGKRGDEIDERREEDFRRIRMLVDKAREELKTESVFETEYWGGDGIWKFEVEREDEEGQEVTFENVVNAHPLIRKWETIVEEETSVLGVDLEIAEKEDAVKLSGEVTEVL